MEQFENVSGIMSAPRLWNTYPHSVRLQTHSLACCGVFSTLCSCGQQPCTLCTQSVSPAQYSPSLICRHGDKNNAVASSFGRSHAKHTPTELPYALAVFVLPACSSGTPSPAGTLFEVIFSSAWEAFIFIFLFSYKYLTYGRRASTC